MATLNTADPHSGSIERTFTIGPLPLAYAQATDFALSPSSNAAYVLTYESTLGTTIASTLSRLSLPGGQTTTTLQIDQQGQAVAVNPKTGIVYMTYATPQGDYTLVSLDPATLKTIQSRSNLTMGPQMSVSPDGARIYLARYGGPGFQVLATSDFSTIDIFTQNGAGVPIPSTDGSMLYVLCGPGNVPASVLFVDATSFQVVRTAQLSISAYLTAGSLSPDGTTLYFGEGTNDGQNFLGILNLTTLDSSSVPVSFFVGSTCVAPDGSSVYIGSQFNNQNDTGIAIYNTATRMLVAHGGLSSAKVALNRTGKVLYELPYQTGPVAVTASVPSEAIVATGSISSQSGYGTYDSKDNLVLIPLNYSQVAIFNASPFRLRDTMTFPDIIGRVLSSGAMAYAFGSGELGANTIHKFVPATSTLQGTLTIPVPLGYIGGTTGAAISADGSRLYLLYTYDEQIGDAAPHNGSFSITRFYEVDTSTMKIVTSTVPPFAYTGGIVISPQGNAGYYIGYSEDLVVTLVEFNPATGVVTQSTTVPNPAASQPSNPVLSPDGETIYVGVGPTLYAYDANSLVATDQVSTSRFVSGLSLTPDGNYLYALGYVVYSTHGLQALGSIPGTTAATPAIFVGH